MACRPDIPVTMVLYRSGDDQIKAAIRTDLLPLLSDHFAPLFVEGAGNAPGEQGYWLHLLHILLSAVDIVLVFDADEQSYSENIFFEQILLRTEGNRDRLAARVFEAMDIEESDARRLAEPMIAFIHIGQAHAPRRPSVGGALSFHVRTASEHVDPIPIFEALFRDIRCRWDSSRSDDASGVDQRALRDAFQAAVLSHPVVRGGTTWGSPHEPNNCSPLDPDRTAWLSEVVDAMLTDTAMLANWAQAKDLIARDRTADGAVARTTSAETLREIEALPTGKRPSRLWLTLKTWWRARSGLKSRKTR